VLRLETELADRADLILAASPALKARFAPDRTVLLPHGVDARLFGHPAPRPGDLPADGPIAGFYGSLSDWIDLPLLAETARRLPDWHFVLIGPIRTDLTPIRDLPNIRLLGERHHHELPGYVQHWTASLLPFRDNAQIRACNPLKLREYFAAGTAVISTDFPALDGYRDLLTVVRSPSGFADALCTARREETERQALRRERVARETWEARAAEVSNLLDALS
jgi:glycosyltransferase involved in cell wall biosynthesis